MIFSTSPGRIGTSTIFSKISAFVAAANRFHPGAAHTRPAQQTQKLHDGVRFADTRVRAGNKKAHANAMLRSADALRCN